MGLLTSSPSSTLSSAFLQAVASAWKEGDPRSLSTHPEAKLHCHSCESPRRVSTMSLSSKFLRRSSPSLRTLLHGILHGSWSSLCMVPLKNVNRMNKMCLRCLDCIATLIPISGSMPRNGVGRHQSGYTNETVAPFFLRYLTMSCSKTPWLSLVILEYSEGALWSTYPVLASSRPPCFEAARAPGHYLE